MPAKFRYRNDLDHTWKAARIHDCSLIDWLTNYLGERFLVKALIGMGDIKMTNFEEQYNIFLYAKLINFQGQEAPFPGAAAWLQAVRTDLRTIEKTQVGKALLKGLKQAGVPVPIAPANPGTCGNSTDPMEGDVGWKKYDGPGMSGPNSETWSGPTIIYSPENNAVGHSCQKRFEYFGQIHIETHETLLHELLHALRWVTATKKGNSVNNNKVKVDKGLSFYGDQEEFFAVLTQGIYASERGAPVRSSHTGHFEIDKELNGSYKFYKTGTETFAYVKKFCTESPGFTKEIAQIKVSFNPIRVYYFDVQLAKKISRESQTARVRDFMMHNAKKAREFVKEYVR